MRRGNWILLPALALCAGSVLAADIPVSALGGNGWFSDDTRADGTGTYPAGTNLVSNTLTDNPEATATGTAAHNGDITNQIVFGTAPGTVPSGTFPGAVHLQIGPSGSGKSQISHRKNDLTGHCTGAAAFGPGMSLEYSWMGDGTLSVTPSVKFGVKTSEYGSTGVSGRTGENVWDKVLIYEPGNLNGGTSDGLWHTESVDFSTGKWWFHDRTAGAGTIGNPMTLANMAVSGMTFSGAKTLADVYALITAPGAIVTSVQFGVGSGNAGASVYVNELTTNFYRVGDTTTFGSPPPVHNVTLDLFYSTIQAAVDGAAPGNTIVVAPGIYEEQVVIGTPLTLRGAGAGATTILSPTTLPVFFASSFNNYPVLYIHHTDGVVVEDLTVDGAGRGNGNYRFTGIGLFEAGAAIQDCAILDIRETPFNGNQHGTGIFAWNPASTRTVTVEDCTVSGYQKNGITIVGPSTSASVINCAVTGVGLTAITAQNGIQLGDLTSAIVDGTSVTGHTYTPATYTACGLLSYGCSGLQVMDSDFPENQTAVYVEDGDGSMSGCTIDLQDPNNPWAVFVYNTGTALATGNGRHLDPSPFEATRRTGSSRSNHVFNVTGCTLTGAQTAGSSGILLYSAGNQLGSTISDCVVTGWDDGIVAYEVGGTVQSTVSNCAIFNNSNSGMYSNAVAIQSAENNWWGHGSGPLDASNDTGSGGLYNPSGLGDAVTNGIDYDPWITSILDGTQVASNSLISVDNAGCPPTTTVTFGITADMVVPEYFGYTFRISYPAGLVPTGYSNNYTPGGTQGLTVATGLNTAGPLVVDWVLFGNTAFSIQTGNLFTVTFDGVADDPAAAITVTQAQFRQHVGAGFISLDMTPSAATVVVVDGTNPVLATAVFPGDPCINANFTVTVTGSDNQGLERVQYRFDNTGTWTDVITGITGTGHGPVGFTTSGVTGLGQGAHTIQVRYVDDVCNAGNQLSWAFNLDTLAPVAPANLVATPDHGIVHLSWTAGSQYTGYRLYSLVRPGYPYWNDGVSGGGNDGLPGVGDPISAPVALATFLPTDPTHFDHSVTDRGVYDYQIEAFDCAPNTLAYSNIASSTNYFLGDWAASPGGLGVYDGYVCSPDVTFLSGSYGLSTTNSPMAEMDVAPASNNSALGLPGPDHVINFEDLIILAINYRLSCATSPLYESRELPGLGKDADVATGGTLRLGHNGETATLTLDGQLLGYSALLRTDRRLVSVESSRGLALHYAVDGGYRVDLVSLDGLLDESSTLTLRFAGEGELELVSADGRDTNNRSTLLPTSGGQDHNLPTAFSLEQNYPNPFNPTTTLRFALPVDSAVELAVYNTLGQKVATVVTGTLAAGWHELAFDGSALASGVYYLQMEAGAYRELKRMVLLK